MNIFEFRSQLIDDYASYINSFIQIRDSRIRQYVEQKFQAGVTSIFCILPVVPCGHKLPIVVLDPTNVSGILYLATCFSSFVLDYVTRQKFGGTSLSFFILKQLPVLPPETYRAICKWDKSVSLSTWILPRALELTYTAWDLEPFAKDCGYDGPPFRWTRSGVSCCAANSTRPIFICMVSSATTLIISWRLSRL